MCFHKSLFACFCLLFCFINFVNAGSFVVSGTVFNEKGAPLAAVKVVETSAKNQVESSGNGRFSIAIQKETVLIRFIKKGYSTQEVIADQSIQLIITLHPESAAINDEIIAPRYKSLLSDADLNGTEASNKDEAKKRNEYYENPFKKTELVPISSFPINVGGTSYSNIYRLNRYSQIPSSQKIHIEELINYFDYSYDSGIVHNGHPIGIYNELSQCPWNKQHQLLLVALQGKNIATELLVPCNLVFLIDVSGSMADAAKLPMLKTSLKLLVRQLRNIDTITIVTYANNAQVALAPIAGSNTDKICNTIDNLQPAGLTAGGEGLQLAYETARKSFIKNGNNRVVFCSDGEFNVGITKTEAIETYIESQTKDGIFLSILGFGTVKQQNQKLKRWADKGNGFYNFMGTLNDANKLFANEYAGHLFTIAKNVRPLVRFNPVDVQAYRLIGYDTKLSAARNTAEAHQHEGDNSIGNGYSITALYELIPAGVKDGFTQQLSKNNFIEPTANVFDSSYIANVEVRYKLPGTQHIKQNFLNVSNRMKELWQCSDNFRFAAAVAEFGLLVKESVYKQKSRYKDVLYWAKSSCGDNVNRKKFVLLVENIQKNVR